MACITFLRERKSKGKGQKAKVKACLPFALCLAVRLLACRKTHDHPRPRSFFALDGDRPSMRSYDLPGKRQAEPGAVAPRGEERLEDPGELIGRDAGAFVLD